jgi:hypothetical protein
MFCSEKYDNRSHKKMTEFRLWTLFLCLGLRPTFVPLWGQNQQPASAQPSSQTSQQTPDTSKPKQDAPPEAGGPGDNVGPYVIPKKKEEEAPPPPRPVTPKKLEDMPDYSLKVNVPLVNVDVLVTTKDGQFVPGLKKDNFRIAEDMRLRTR